MQREIDDLGNEDPEQFEDEESVTDLCKAPRLPYKLNKGGRRIVADLIDRVRREDASKTAKVQDSQRRYVGSDRYDVNSYAGGPVTIPDLCVIKKRKIR